jgi:SAM-dependent methyltransferase
MPLTLPRATAHLSQAVASINAAGGTYHQFNLDGGLVIQGDYDMDQYLRYYHIPENLEGKTVLDVGTASGYFAVLCACRGAQVTAIDIEDKPLAEQLFRVFGVDVRYVKKDVYTLDETFGAFDMVICGSLLVHLPDPLGAARRLRSVCAGRAIVATCCSADSRSNPRPICDFIGLRAGESDYWAYWNLSAAALKKMLLAAGFWDVDNVEHFSLKADSKRRPFDCHHVAMTAWASAA